MNNGARAKQPTIEYLHLKSSPINKQKIKRDVNTPGRCCCCCCC